MKFIIYQLFLSNPTSLHFLFFSFPFIFSLNAVSPLGSLTNCITTKYILLPNTVLTIFLHGTHRSILKETCFSHNSQLKVFFRGSRAKICLLFCPLVLEHFSGHHLILMPLTVQNSTELFLKQSQYFPCKVCVKSQYEKSIGKPYYLQGIANTALFVNIKGEYGKNK